MMMMINATRINSNQLESAQIESIPIEPNPFDSIRIESIRIQFDEFGGCYFKALKNKAPLSSRLAAFEKPRKRLESETPFFRP